MNMEKMDLKSMDIVEENFKKIEELFPEAIVETTDKDGNEIRKIDIHRLSQEMSNRIVDNNAERYQFTWPKKKNSILLSNLAIDRTLRPQREKSVDFDNTENLYIEGDNLDVLKLLQKSYQGKIKCIYIDPPYNTGHDFVYEDDFASSATEFSEMEKNIDDEGNKLRTNSDAEGKYHTNWLNMMYPRLRLAKRLLSEDGVIFISIDDNEQANLKKMCDEVFGEKNNIAEFVIIRAEGGGLAKQIIKGHDYLFVYASNIRKFIPLGKEKDVRGRIVVKNGEKFWIQEDWLRKEFGKYGNCHYEEIEKYKGLKKLDEINKGLEAGQYQLIEKANGLHIVGKLRSISSDSSKFYSILKHLSAKGIEELKELGLSDYFSYPKPVELIKELVSGSTIFSRMNHDIVLDFFSGSATTAHAVMQLNAEDGGNRKFIMVQLPEVCDENSEAYQAGYKNICEIGEERIRRAGKKILADMQEKGNDLFSEEKKLDTGFRVLKLDSSNMNDVDQLPEKFVQKDLDNFIGNFKPDRSSEDILFQSLLSYGLDLSSKIEVKIISGVKVYSVNEGYLIACLDNGINDDVATEIAKAKPRYALFKDSAITEDSTLTNFDQIFQQFSPDTERSVL